MNPSKPLLEWMIQVFNGPVNAGNVIKDFRANMIDEKNPEQIDFDTALFWFVAGMLNIMNPKSEFNTKYKLTDVSKAP